jgi:hypothetical protein
MTSYNGTRHSEENNHSENRQRANKRVEPMIKLNRVSRPKLFDRLSAIKRDYQELYHGYRTGLYETLQKIMEIVISCRMDPNLKRKMLRAAGKEPDGSLTRALVGYALGDATKEAGKRAWKYARILDYLVDKQEIAVDDLAVTIARQGIEKLVRDAADEDPRAAQARMGTKASGEILLTSKRSVAKHSTEPNDGLTATLDRESNSQPPTVGLQKPEGDQTVRLDIPSAMLEKLNTIPSGGRVKIIAVRSGGNSGLTNLRVRKLVKIKEKSTAEQWAD